MASVIIVRSSPPRARLAAGTSALFIVLLGALNGCHIEVDPTAEYDRAQHLFTEATGLESIYTPGQSLSDHEINQVLADGLTLDEALRLALLNNRSIQAAFLDIGIAKADWVQSGLLTNPTLGFSVVFPEGGGRTDLVASMGQSIIELWQIPVRQDIAQHALNQTVLRIARQAAFLATDIKQAYYHSLIAKMLNDLTQNDLGITRKTREAAKKRETSASDDISEALSLTPEIAAELAFRNARLKMHNAKRRLARLMSLDRDFDDVELPDALPQIEDHSLDPDRVIQLARTSRLDLRALELQVAQAEQSVLLEHKKVISELAVGASYERPERRALQGRYWLTETLLGLTSGPGYESRSLRNRARAQIIDAKSGFNFNVTVPIWDQNQAQISAAEYQYLQATIEYESTYLQIAQDIRIGIDNARTAVVNLSLYTGRLIPHLQDNLSDVRESYKKGTSDILTLLRAQDAVIDARTAYTETLFDSVQFFSDLEKTVGVAPHLWIRSMKQDEPAKNLDLPERADDSSDPDDDDGGL